MILFNAQVKLDDDDVIREVHSSHNIEEVFPDNEIIKYVKEQFNPGQVFDTLALELWAEDHGYVKMENL